MLLQTSGQLSLISEKSRALLLYMCGHWIWDAGRTQQQLKVLKLLLTQLMIVAGTSPNCFRVGQREWQDL